MKRTDADYLADIVTAAKNARAFVEGLELLDFLADVEKQYAVTRALEIIGEAARNISLQFQQDHPEVPWREMVGMRNVVIHAYFGVDETVIWRTVQEDLPDLLDVVRDIPGS